jgi:hypothetical protein
VSVYERRRTASYHPRVPHVVEAAVAADVALIGGYAAWFLHELIEATPGGLGATLARSGVPLDRRAEVLRAWAALGEVGGRWRMGASTSGRPEGQPDEQRIGSMSASDVGVVLGITARAVRWGPRAARPRAGGPPHGRWVFAAADVAAEQTRRAQRAAA